MSDIYNQKLEKYADGNRHIFTATFIKKDDKQGIFKNLTADNEENVVVEQIALRMTKAFRELDLKQGDVIQFEAIVKKNKRGEFTVERPTRAETIDTSKEVKEDEGVHVVSDNWNWFEE